MDKYVNVILLVVTLSSLAVTLWNTYNHQLMKLLLTEMQLNLKREFNGKYVNIVSFQDAKDRITRLEADHDSH